VSDTTCRREDDRDDAFVAAYLRRLELAGYESAGLEPAGPTLLRRLHLAHLRHVPFENISIHSGEPLSLEHAALADKILARNRGGFCYELNGLFADLLDHLGFDVTLFGARVWGGHAYGPPLDHLVLSVGTTITEGRWIVDVGFGDHSHYPLPWDEGITIEDPAGSFRLEATADGDFDVYRDGAVQYRIEPHPRALSDFEAMCWYHQTSPRSHFTRSLVCTRLSDGGRVTLSGRRLITTTADGRHEIALGDDNDVLAAYRTVFGIELDQAPTPIHGHSTSEFSRPA
jgi:N-hydroxyarylamine O-acetyltransferase